MLPAVSPHTFHMHEIIFPVSTDEPEEIGGIGCKTSTEFQMLEYFAHLAGENLSAHRKIPGLFPSGNQECAYSGCRR